MSTPKWKYALLPADERIKLVRGGNADVYNSEMARTRSVIKERESLGLDTNSQVDWANKLGYNYNLGNAESMGISPDSVNKTGYGERMLSSWKEPEKSSEKKNRTQSGSSLHRVQLGLYKAAEERRIRKRFAQYKAEAKKDMENYSSVIREDLINNGANPNGGKAIEAELRTREQLMSLLADYDAKMQSAIADNNEYYEGLADKSYDRAYKNAALALEKQKQSDENDRWYAEKYYDYLRDRQSDANRQSENAEDTRRWEAEFARKKERDSVEDETRREEQAYDRRKDEESRARWEKEFAFEKEKEATDKEQWEKRLAFDREKERTDYEMWLAERQFGRR